MVSTSKVNIDSRTTQNKNMKKNTQKNTGPLVMGPDDVALHGECKITLRINPIPATAKRVHLDGGHLIVAPSETTGNHHFVDMPAEAEAWKDGDTIYLNSPVPFKVACVMADRHDTVEHAPGEYEFGFQEEFDHHAARTQRVRD